MQQFRPFFISMFIVLMLGASAKELQVASMIATQDVMGVAMQRNDLNGNPCALVNVMLPMPGCEFAGNIIGNVEFKVNKYRVYLSPKTKYLQVDCPGYTSLRLTFSDFGIDHVESRRIYNLNFVLRDEVAAQQSVLFKITPQKATIMVDNDVEYEVVDGQITVNLDEGEHSYVAYSEGYKMNNNIFKVTKGQNKVLIELDPKTAPVANITHPRNTTPVADNKPSTPTPDNKQAISAADNKPDTPTNLSPVEFEVKGVKFRMIPIEGGTFEMGATGKLAKIDDSDDKPTHKVTLSDYMLGETEVTQALWKAVMGKNPSKFKRDEQPVESVSWKDCQKFINKLNKLTGQDFRLPTEAEWEYAAKGGKMAHGYMYSGSDTIDEVAEYGMCNQSADVGTKQANELGLYDMSGNVYEWCNDWYDSYTSEPQTNPKGPNTGSSRVIRGGCWGSYNWYCKVSERNNRTPSSPSYQVGLRLALTSQR